MEAGKGTDTMAKELSQELFEKIAGLKTQEECAAFFAKLWNPSELRAMEQRIDLAKFLQQGAAYLDVLEQAGADSEALKEIRAAMLEHGTGGIIEELIQRDTSQDIET